MEQLEPTCLCCFPLFSLYFCMKDEISISTHLLCNLGLGKIPLNQYYMQKWYLFFFQMGDLKFFHKCAFFLYYFSSYYGLFAIAFAVI